MVDKKPPQHLTGIKLPTDAQQIPGGFHPFGPYVPGGIFSHDAHNNLIKTKGFKATHWSHALNPARTTVEAGVDLSKETDVGAFNLYDPKEFYIAIQQLNWNDQYIIQGVHGNMAINAVNYTSYYEDSGEEKERVYLSKNDVIMINSGMTVLVRQLFEYKPTGPMRLKFPIVEVQYLADGNDVRYEQGTDFVIENGMINWISQNRPSWDAKNGRGAPLSVAYWTYPYFSVIQTPRVFRNVFTNYSGNDSLPSDPTYISGSAIVKCLWLDDIGNISIPDWPKFQEPDRTHNTRS